MKRLWIWIPLALFFLFFGVVANGLMYPAEQAVVSKMVGKPAPSFSLTPAIDTLPGVGSANLIDGKPKLVNIFASWCIPCAQEAPVLEELARRGVEIHGIAIRDRRQDLNRFLERNGNPYTRIGLDTESKVQIAFGSAGVPESFLIDGKGIVRRQIVGDIRPGDVNSIVAELRNTK